MTLLERLEACVAQYWWRPRGVDVVDRPDLCYLHSTLIPALNVVLRLNAPPADLPALVAEVHQAHRHAGSMCWAYPHRHGDVLGRLLGDRGYVLQGHGEARVIEIDAYRPRAVDGISVSVVETIAGCRAGTAVNNAAFGTNRAYTDDEYRQMLALCHRVGARRKWFAACDDATGALLATGSISLHPDQGLAVLLGGGTVPEFRGRGAYSALLAARIACARDHGLRWVGLFADPDTSAPIVGRRGFIGHGRRERWVRPPGKRDAGEPRGDAR